jgi:hypothetical protein
MKPNRTLRMLNDDIRAQKRDKGEDPDNIEEGVTSKGKRKGDLSKGMAHMKKRGHQKIDFSGERIQIFEKDDPSSI